MRYTWLRLYHDTIADPKIRTLSLLVRWVWITILCLASASTRRGWIRGFDAKSLTEAAGLSPAHEQDVTDAIRMLVGARMLRDTTRGWHVANFEARQYDKPSARPQRVNQRVVKHRRNALVTPVKHPVTPRGEERREEKKRRESTSTSAATEQVIFTPEHFQLPAGTLERWIEAYPAVDVVGAIKRAHSWATDNPSNRKKNWGRFLVNWLAADQEKAPRIAANGPSAPQRFDGPMVPSVEETQRMLGKLRNVMRDL